jgi:hypothetical protein
MNSEPNVDDSAGFWPLEYRAFGAQFTQYAISYESCFLHGQH